MKWTTPPLVLIPQFPDWLRCHRCRIKFQGFWPNDEADAIRRPWCMKCGQNDEVAPVADDTLLHRSLWN